MAIFGVKREKVKDIRRKRTLETLKERKQEAEAKRKREALGRKAEKAKAEASYYKAKAERKRAKREAGFQWPILPTAKVKIRKKKQGKKLSSKRRIGLI